MEIVNENEEAAPQQPNSLEEERSRMLSNVQKASQGMSGPPSASDGPRLPARKSSIARTDSMSRRGAPMRSNSMRGSGGGVRPLAPTKSTDCMASMRGSSLQRVNSSRLQRASGVGPNSSRGQIIRSVSSRAPPPSRGHIARSVSSRAPPSRRAPPARTSSEASTNSLRAHRRDVLSNMGIDGRKDEMARLPGPGATLERHTSGEMSVITAGDLSCFTMDSVNLRKTQLVADPIEDGGTYNEEESFADHESISRASCFSEYAPPTKASAAPARMGVYRTPSRMGAIKFDKLQIASSSAQNSNSHTDDDSDDDDDSFGTMTSGLTTDFTEHEELMDSDDEEE